MIDHIWTVICSNVVTDKETNNLSLHNVIEQLSIEPIPDAAEEQLEVEEQDRYIVPYRITVATLWSRRDLNKGSIGYGKISFISPTGEQLIEPAEFEINVFDNRRFRSKGNFRGVPITGPGKYLFKVEFKIDETSNWNTAAEVPLEIRMKKENSISEPQ